MIQINGEKCCQTPIDSHTLQSDKIWKSTAGMVGRKD